MLILAEHYGSAGPPLLVNSLQNRVGLLNEVISVNSLSSHITHATLLLRVLCEGKGTSMGARGKPH